MDRNPQYSILEKAEGRRQKAEGRRQRVEGRGQKAEAARVSADADATRTAGNPTVCGWNRAEVSSACVPPSSETRQAEGRSQEVVFKRGLVPRSKQEPLFSDSVKQSRRHEIDRLTAKSVSQRPKIGENYAIACIVNPHA